MMDKKTIVEDIIQKEWVMFDKVNNEGGRASCQNNYPTFHIMRQSQFLAWNEKMLESYLRDLENAKAEGRNLLTEKYAYMMESTYPEEYEKIKNVLPVVPQEKMDMIEEISTIYMKQTEEFAAEYPRYMTRTRPVHSKDDKYFTSIETYLKCELKTYSENTVKEYVEYLKELDKEGKKIVYMIFENTVKCYGYDSLKDAEAKM